MTLETVDVNIPTGRGPGHNSPGVTTTPGGENKWATTAKLVPVLPLRRDFDMSGQRIHLGVPPEVAADVEVGDLIASPTPDLRSAAFVFEVLEKVGRWADSFEIDPDMPSDGREDWQLLLVAPASDKVSLENEAVDFANRMQKINRDIESARVAANQRAVEELIDRAASADHEQLTVAINAIGPEARDKFDSALKASEPAVAA